MRYLFIGFISVLFSSCTPFLDQPNIEYQLGGGAFVVNEGNFLGGNSSLSFFSYDSLEVFNDLFSSNNSRPLGDVANSMVNFGDNGYIVVNNSGKIEVIDQKSFKSKATISGLVSPRNMAILNESKAYVTSMYSDSIAILNLYSNTISGYINLGKTSEAIVVNGSTAYVSNWLGGNKVFVINTMLDKVIDSITVGLEPESLVLDRYYRLWALCTGGWQKTQKAELDLINTGSDRIEQRFVFSTLQDSPSCLAIDGLGEFIYYLNKGVWKMDINSPSLPDKPFIPESGQMFYKLAVNPANGDILITDVVDYVQNGYLLVHRNDGTLGSKHRVGVIPGGICFSITATAGKSNKSPSNQAL